ncbi:MAG TPA: integrase family protein [Gammaproteobacteria bacterium]|nr:integrase family protein [Gammaproteobacteria bacterium]
MAKVKLTAGRIAAFQCDKSNQSFLWCAEVPGLGVRATPKSDEKRYVFQAKVKGKSVRLTIGKVSIWSIPEAQIEARRLQILIDQGNDPRQIKANEKIAKEQNDIVLKQKEARESVTLGEAWAMYISERKPYWSLLHYRDHVNSMQRGGEKRKRSNKLTESGTLLSLSSVRLVDVSSELIEQWAKNESLKRPTRARLSLRLLKAFLFWCAKHPTFKNIVKENPAQSKKAREYFGKSKLKNDVLQREQLSAWFAAIKMLSNSVISAYLQILLLTGARREEIATLRWSDVDFQWRSLTIRDKVEGVRVIPLPPYVAHLLSMLPRRNSWVFSSPTSASGRLIDPSIAHRRACAVAGLDMSLHGLRRSFATLCEWIETPAGIAAQIQGHKPQGIREKNYIRRPLDLLRMWHIKIEVWILNEAKIEFDQQKIGLRVVAI